MIYPAFLDQAGYCCLAAANAFAHRFQKLKGTGKRIRSARKWGLTQAPYDDRHARKRVSGNRIATALPATQWIMELRRSGLTDAGDCPVGAS